MPCRRDQAAVSVEFDQLIDHKLKVPHKRRLACFLGAGEESNEVDTKALAIKGAEPLRQVVDPHENSAYRVMPGMLAFMRPKPVDVERYLQVEITIVNKGGVLEAARRPTLEVRAIVTPCIARPDCAVAMVFLSVRSGLPLIEGIFHAFILKQQSQRGLDPAMCILQRWLAVRDGVSAAVLAKEHAVRGDTAIPKIEPTARSAGADKVSRVAFLQS